MDDCSSELLCGEGRSLCAQTVENFSFKSMDCLGLYLYVYANVVIAKISKKENFGKRNKKIAGLIRVQLFKAENISKKGLICFLSVRLLPVTRNRRFHSSFIQKTRLSNVRRLLLS